MFMDASRPPWFVFSDHRGWTAGPEESSRCADQPVRHDGCPVQGQPLHQHRPPESRPRGSWSIYITSYPSCVVFLSACVVPLCRCCSPTPSAAMLTSSAITWWLSCKNVSKHQKVNENSFPSVQVTYLWSNTHPLNPDHKHPPLHHVHVFLSYNLIWSRQMGMLWFAFNKWKWLFLFQSVPDSPENNDANIKKIAKEVLDNRAYICSHPLERTYWALPWDLVIYKSFNIWVIYLSLLLH